MKICPSGFRFMRPSAFINAYDTRAKKNSWLTLNVERANSLYGHLGALNGKALPVNNKVVLKHRIAFKIVECPPRI